MSRRLPAKIGVAAAALVVALLVAEVLARLLGPHSSGLGIVNYLDGIPTRTVDGVVLWDANNLRATAADIAEAAADQNAFTIVGLGDSIMFGVGLDKSETYLEHTSHQLAERTGRTVRALNLAVVGYNTLQENARYKEIAGTLRPDLVVLHYWGNDVWQFRVIGGYAVDFADVMPDGSIHRALPLPQGLSDFLLLHSRLYDLLTDATITRYRNTDAYDWSRVTRPLAEIDERAHAAGTRLLVLASADLGGPTVRPTADLAQLHEFTDSRGIEVVDLSEWLHDVPTQRIALDACHLNAQGHHIVGERLADHLLATGL